MPSKRIARLIKILSGVATNAEDEILVLEGRMERFAHFWVLVIRQFVRNRCLVRASALSYATLLALIPLLVIALSVTSSLLKSQGQDKFEHAIDKFISSVIPPATIGTNVITVNTSNAADLAISNPAPTQVSGGDTNLIAGATNAVPAGESRVAPVTAQKEITRQIWGFVQSTQQQSGKLGATGVVLLLFVAVSLLGRIEETFNDIWGVVRGRSWLHQIQLYSAAIMLGPVLLIAALSLAGSAHFESAKDFIAHTPVIGKFIFDLLPLLVLWLAFAFVYQLVPNTKVNFSAALAGGAVAGTLWYLNNLFGVLYVSRVVTNMKFYGSLGLVPVFMIGLYFSWVFLLLGAQIAYAFQNRIAYLQDRLAENINQRGREFVALRIMTLLGQRFQNGLRPATVPELSIELGVPSRLTESVLRTLASARLVTETAGAEVAYVPARPIENINAYDILLALRTVGGQELQLRDEPALAGIYGEFARIEQAERETAAKISLLNLASRLSPRVELPAPEVVPAEKQIEPKKNISAPDKIIATGAAPENPPLKPSNVVEEKPVAEAPPEKPAARREVVQPEDKREFPL
jgi:membrane protein